MSEEKLVSVCINAYNSADVIAQTIESVLNQTYKNLQIIVVDDCSTDNTAEVVKSFDDERIELYSLPKNGNISNANNECLHRARGEYIAHLDSDDIWVADKIEKQVKFLEENPQYGACFSYAGFIDEHSNILTKENLPLNHLNLYVHENMPQSGFVRSFFAKSTHLLNYTSTIAHKTSPIPTNPPPTTYHNFGELLPFLPYKIHEIPLIAIKSVLNT